MTATAAMPIAGKILTDDDGYHIPDEVVKYFDESDTEPSVFVTIGSYLKGVNSKQPADILLTIRNHYTMMGLNVNDEIIASIVEIAIREEPDKTAQIDKQTSAELAEIEVRVRTTGQRISGFHKPKHLLRKVGRTKCTEIFLDLMLINNCLDEAIPVTVDEQFCVIMNIDYGLYPRVTTMGTFRTSTESKYLGIKNPCTNNTAAMDLLKRCQEYRQRAVKLADSLDAEDNGEKDLDILAATRVTKGANTVHPHEDVVPEAETPEDVVPEVGPPTSPTTSSASSSMLSKTVNWVVCHKQLPKAEGPTYLVVYRGWNEKNNRPGPWATSTAGYLGRNVWNVAAAVSEPVQVYAWSGLPAAVEPTMEEERTEVFGRQAYH